MNAVQTEWLSMLLIKTHEDLCGQIIWDIRRSNTRGATLI